VKIDSRIRIVAIMLIVGRALQSSVPRLAESMVARFIPRAPSHAKNCSLLTGSRGRALRVGVGVSTKTPSGKHGNHTLCALLTSYMYEHMSDIHHLKITLRLGSCILWKWNIVLVDLAPLPSTSSKSSGDAELSIGDQSVTMDGEKGLTEIM
jgi:hypothetical protein